MNRLLQQAIRKSLEANEKIENLSKETGVIKKSQWKLERAENTVTKIKSSLDQLTNRVEMTAHKVSEC